MRSRKHEGARYQDITCAGAQRAEDDQTRKGDTVGPCGQTKRELEHGRHWGSLRFDPIARGFHGGGGGGGGGGGVLAAVMLCCWRA